MSAWFHPSSYVFRPSFGSRFLLTAFLLFFAYTLPATGQVYVGGVQSQIAGSPWNGPVGVASDTSGNIYIAQYSANSSIIKIDAKTHVTSTLISTSASVCGSTLSDTQALASDSSNNLYIADQGNGRVLVYNHTFSTCTASYTVTNPFAIALDSSANIWVTTDAGSSSKVSEIPANSATGTQATAVVASGLTDATGIAFDSKIPV
jgi:hypothetical protein